MGDYLQTISQCIFLGENICISIQILMILFPGALIDNKSALVQAMAWCRSGDKPLPEPMLTSVAE